MLPSLNFKKNVLLNRMLRSTSFKNKTFPSGGKNIGWVRYSSVQQERSLVREALDSRRKVGCSNPGSANKYYATMPQAKRHTMCRALPLQLFTHRGRVKKKKQKEICTTYQSPRETENRFQFLHRSCLWVCNVWWPHWGHRQIWHGSCCSWNASVDFEVSPTFWQPSIPSNFLHWPSHVQLPMPSRSRQLHLLCWRFSCL